MVVVDEMQKVLGVLADCPDGSTLPSLIGAHDCSRRAVQQCLKQNYLYSRSENVWGTDILRLWITQAGRKALALPGK